VIFSSVKQRSGYHLKYGSVYGEHHLGWGRYSHNSHPLLAIVAVVRVSLNVCWPNALHGGPIE
jgi:hypothetical protein